MKLFKNLFAKKEEEPKQPVDFGEVAFSDASEAMFDGVGKSIQKYNPSIIISNKGFDIIDKMRRDDQVKAAMTFKKNTVIANGWEVVSPEGQEVDWEVTKFIHDNLKDMTGTFERRLLNVMSAMDYGFSATEKVYEAKDGKIWLSAIKTRKPHDILISSDAFGNLTELEQYGNKLPIEKFILYSYESEFDNHYGTPDLDSSYRAWWTKDNTYKWFAMLLERMGIPPIFAMYDPVRYQGEKLNGLRSVLENLQAATTATIPKWKTKEGGDSIDFWAPELAKNIGDVFIPSLDMLNRDIARSILMPGLLGVTPDDNVGSNARSSVHFDVFMLVIERIRKEIEEHIMQEQIIKPLVDLNYNVSEYPQFKFMPLTDDLRADLIDKWINLTNSKIVKGQPDDETHIRKLFDFPERDTSNDDINDGTGDGSHGDDDDNNGDDNNGSTNDNTGDNSGDNFEDKGDKEPLNGFYINSIDTILSNKPDKEFDTNPNQEVIIQATSTDGKKVVIKKPAKEAIEYVQSIKSRYVNALELIE